MSIRLLTAKHVVTSAGSCCSRRPHAISLPPSPTQAVQRRNLHDGRNRLSSFWAPTGGITASEAGEEPSISLLKRAGFVRQSHSGIFHLLPLGLRVQGRIERIIDHEMRSIGASKLSLSSISSEALWEKSGRLAKNPELLRLNDRKESKFILSPTHEEEITTLVSGIVKSYKDLPVRLYQMSRKYRDELRPRQGLLRAKEFLMKDLYTFDLTETDALRTYADVKAAYVRIFDQLGLEYVVADADSGNMGGTLSHEYQLLSPIGEDTILRCKACGHTANEEVSSKSSKNRQCSNCEGGALHEDRAIEVGHTFHLGTRYSDSLKASVADKSDRQVPIQMGCHGIGVSRIIAAAASLRSVESGLRWPLSIAPFKFVIICDKETLEAATALYDTMRADLFEKTHAETPVMLMAGQRSSSSWLASDDVIIDDRDKSIGWKLKDADLIGYPVALVLGSQWKKNKAIDIVRRDDQNLSASGARNDHSWMTKTLQSILQSHENLKNSLSLSQDDDA